MGGWRHPTAAELCRFLQTRHSVERARVRGSGERWRIPRWKGKGRKRGSDHSLLSQPAPSSCFYIVLITTASTHPKCSWHFSFQVQDCELSISCCRFTNQSFWPESPQSNGHNGCTAQTSSCRSKLSTTPTVTSLGGHEGTSFHTRNDCSLVITLGYARCFQSLAGEASDSNNISTQPPREATSWPSSKVAFLIVYSTGEIPCKPVLYFSPLIPVK